MSNQELAEALKWAAIEIETQRPNWSEVLRASLDVAHQARALAEGQFAERFAKQCPRCGGAL